MIGVYDSLNIVFYVLFIVGVGAAFSRRSRNTSDFFRSGGSLPWWITGTSAWMVSFSAWTFTGAAGKMYESGPYVLGLYYSALVPQLALLAVTAARFRRMRVVTPIEAVRLRYGAGVQQFFAWMRLPFLLLFVGVSLNALGTFVAAVFGVPLPLVIVGLGVALTLLAAAGGAFGLAASDFVQMLLVVTVTLTVAVLALNLPEIGGWGGMWRRAPLAHRDWGGLARPGLIAAWVASLAVTKLFESNSMDAAGKYLMARNERHARLAVVIPVVGILVAPWVWLVPPTVAAIRHPEIGALFPALKFPHEAAFVLTACEVLPQGMMGLLICGMFAASLPTLNADLNQAAGIFVRNFYLPVLRPGADERRLLTIGKLATAVFGGAGMGIGLLVARYSQSNLFDLVNQLAVSLVIPLTLPLAFGLYFRRTPAWSAWSTVLVGLACSLAVRAGFRPELLDGWLGLRGPFLPEEATQLRLIATVAGVAAVSTAWYFLTSLTYGRTSKAYREAVDAFFERLHTPMNEREEPEREERGDVIGSTGTLCLLYGGFVAACCVIPNPVRGRLCFLACGSVLVAVGLLLRFAARKSQSRP